jgi:hypothetical protein
MFLKPGALLVLRAHLLRIIKEMICLKKVILRQQVCHNMPTKKEKIDPNKIPPKMIVGLITPFCITIRKFNTAN